MRRSLQFDSFDQVVQDIGLLQSQGYDRGGKWTLGQICDHLAIFMRGSLDGFSTRLPWLLRATVGRFFTGRILKQRKMPAGWKAPSEFLPGSPADDASSVAALLSVMERFQTHAGPLKPSPFAGTLSRDEWMQLHLIHATHHLSFLRPKA